MKTRKEKLSFLRKLQAKEPLDEFLPKTKLIFIENKKGIHEVSSGKKFERPELQEYINKVKSENPFMKIEPLLIKIRRVNKSINAV